MKQLTFLLALMAVPLLLAACAGNENSTPPTIEVPALIMFYTDNWLPWEEMEPIVNGLENEFTGDAAVLQLNANEADNARMQQQYGMRGHPTFAILDADGRLARIFIGPQSTEVLREALTAVVEVAN